MLKEKGSNQQQTFIFWYYSFIIVISLKNSSFCSKWFYQKSISLVRSTPLLMNWLGKHSLNIFYEKVTSATKAITCRNVLLSEAQIKIFFLRRKVMFCSQGIQVFAFLTITWFTMSVISRWILLVHKTGYFFDSQLIKSPDLANW